MLRFIIHLVINAAAVWAAAALLQPGIEVLERTPADRLLTILIVALIFGFVNALIKPIVKVVTCPIYVLTLGLFTFVVNGALFYLASSIADALGRHFVIHGFLTAIVGAVIVSVVSFVLSLVLEPGGS